MEFVQDYYHLPYKPNSRESFRKEGINILLNYGLIELNPDNKQLGPNSPLTHYAIKESVLKQIRELWNNGNTQSAAV